MGMCVRHACDAGGLNASQALTQNSAALMLPEV